MLDFMDIIQIQYGTVVLMIMEYYRESKMDESLKLISEHEKIMAEIRKMETKNSQYIRQFSHVISILEKRHLIHDKNNEIKGEIRLPNLKVFDLQYPEIEELKKFIGGTQDCLKELITIEEKLKKSKYKDYIP